MIPPPDADHARWFTDHVLPHESALRAWLRSRFPSLLDPDDVVQESYMRLLRVHETGPVANPRAFLFVSARNFALNHLRHRRYEQRDEATEVDATEAFADVAGGLESLTRAEDLGVLVQAIQALPDRCRAIITLRKIYGLSQKEVALQLGISEHTVEAQTGIGLRKCIEFFRRNGYGRDTRP